MGEEKRSVFELQFHSNKRLAFSKYLSSEVILLCEKLKLFLLCLSFFPHAFLQYRVTQQQELISTYGFTVRSVFNSQTKNVNEKVQQLLSLHHTKQHMQSASTVA